jgi:arabinogalactan oligomer / maltooligosaccharide transport system substrate-binding protein
VKFPLRLLALVLVLSLALAACGDDAADEDAGADTDDTDEADDATDEGEGITRADADLVIWADDGRTPVLQPFADAFGEENGVEVVLQDVPFDEIREQLVTAGPAGEGPDIIIGAHDWLGELVENGVVATVDLTGIADELQEVAVQAFTYEGNTYGLPYATESVALIRNTDLVPDAPATWDELEEVGMSLVDGGEIRQAIVWPTEPADPYHNYPMVTAHGGYVFGQEADGTYIPDDIGLDSDGAIAAAHAFRGYVESGLISPDVTYDLMIDLFATGDAAFAITGPWALGDFADVPFEVTPIPDIDGGTPQPFVGVQGFMVSSFSENELLAQTFLVDYMATEDAQVALFEAGHRPPAMVSAFEQVSDDPNIQGFGESGAEGLPMPAIPEMGSVWEAWTNAYELIYEGTVEPDQAFEDAAAQIRELTQ